MTAMIGTMDGGPLQNIAQESHITGEKGLTHSTAGHLILLAVTGISEATMITGTIKARSTTGATAATATPRPGPGTATGDQASTTRSATARWAKRRGRPSTPASLNQYA